MLHLLLGYRTDSRLETPKVLFIGHQASELEAAIARAPKTLRLERGELAVLRRARRPQPAGSPSTEEPPSAPPRTIVVPLLETVLDAGYSTGAATRIVAVARAQADALAANPKISDEDLAAIEEAFPSPLSPATPYGPGPTDPQAAAGVGGLHQDPNPGEPPPGLGQPEGGAATDDDSGPSLGDEGVNAGGEPVTSAPPSGSPAGRGGHGRR